MKNLLSSSITAVILALTQAGFAQCAYGLPAMDRSQLTGDRTGEVSIVLEEVPTLPEQQSCGNSGDDDGLFQLTRFSQKVVAATKPAVGAGCKVMRGVASYYGQGDNFAGRKTASGEAMNPNAMSAAMRTFDARKGMGGIFNASVSCPDGSSINVKVDDWGPAAGTGRLIDLSPRAAEACGIKKAGQFGGIGNVEVHICGH